MDILGEEVCVFNGTDLPIFFPIVTNSSSNNGQNALTWTLKEDTVSSSRCTSTASTLLPPPEEGGLGGASAGGLPSAGGLGPLRSLRVDMGGAYRCLGVTSFAHGRRGEGPCTAGCNDERDVGAAVLQCLARGSSEL